MTKTLHRTVKRGVSAGEPLPTPWPIFDKYGISIRRGSISMIAAPPGGMKSTLGLNIVNEMGSAVPVLYHSSDSDDFTMASRTLAMLTGKNTDDTELMVMGQSDLAYDILKDFEHVRWSFRSSPTIEHMKLEAEAYREIKGTYPHLTVLDIMMDVDYPGVPEQNYWALMAELKDIARDQETAMLVIHHTSESAKAGSPPPRAAIMGKANQLPALIITLWGDARKEELQAAVVKNRFGPQDATARDIFYMKAQPSVMKISEMEQKVSVPLNFHDGLSVRPEDKINNTVEVDF